MSDPTCIIIIYVHLIKLHNCTRLRDCLCLLNVQWDTQATVKHFYLSQHYSMLFCSRKKNKKKEC